MPQPNICITLIVCKMFRFRRWSSGLLIAFSRIWNEGYLYIVMNHILPKVFWCDYNLETVLNIESFQRDVTLVAARDKVEVSFRGTFSNKEHSEEVSWTSQEKSKKDSRWTLFEENDGGYKKVRVLLMKASGLVLMTKKINGEINCVWSFLLRFTG